MGSYNHGELLTFSLPTNTPEDAPYVFDAHSLAFSLGIRVKTLWWLLLTNTIKQQERGTGLYKEFKIPKRGKSKKHRVIHEPCEALKNVQKALLVTYFNHLPAPDHMGAYVIGRGLEYTAKQHVGKAVKIAMDIKDFFPNTRRSWVRNWLFRSFKYNKWVVNTLSNLMVIPKRNKKKVVYSSLPQGAPTSGLVANYVADYRIDRPVMEFLNDTGYSHVYTRYSDNLEISFDEDLSRETIDKIVGKITDTIHRRGYRVNHKKTNVQRQKSPDYSMRVLGMTVNEKLNIPRQEYRRLRAIVHNCATKGFTTQYQRMDKESPEELYDHLFGKLNYWKQIREEKMQPLLDKLTDAAREQNIVE